MGSIGRIVENDCPNPHTNPSTSISTLNFILNGLHSFRYGINSQTKQFFMFWIYCNDIFMLNKPISSEFILTACNNFFVVAITPYCNDFVVIATIYSVVIDLFSCSVMCPNHVKYTHVNSQHKHTKHMTKYKIMLLKPTIVLYGFSLCIKHN